MAWTDAQQQYCYYVICTVESGCDYGATYTVDPITVGIAQWYGYRAANLINRLKTDAADSYAKLTERIRSAADAIDETDWDNFYLNQDDVASWQASAQDKANHNVQDAQFYDDLSGYLSTLANWGTNTNNVKGTIFLISMYHQSPAACRRILSNIGGDRSIDEYKAAALGDATLGGYSNRYNTVYKLLNEWDGTSEPPDFGQSGPTEVSQETPSETVESNQLSSTVGYVESVGNDLVIFGAMASTGKLVCHYNGNGIWLPISSTIPDQPSSPDNPDIPPYTPPTGDEPADWPACKALWEEHAGDWYYSNGAGRLDPPNSGYSDCSACIWWAVHTATNGKYDWLGTRSYTMDDTATLVRTFDPDSVLDTSDMIPGDLIIMQYGAGSTLSGGHVDWYWGNGTIWSAGYGPLPHHETDDVTNYYKDHNYKWKIATIGIYRFLE